MKQHRFISILMMAGLLLVTGFATNAMAWVSVACDTIQNQATLSYSVGGVPQTDIDSDSDGDGTPETTDFQVGSLVDLTVAAVTYPVNATGSDQVMTFQVDNTGNDTQRYELAVYAGASGDTLDSGAVTDNFDMSTDGGQSVDVYTDTDNNYSNGGTTLIQASVPTDGTALATLTADVAANGTIFVHIIADVPAGTAAGSVAIYSLSANTFQVAALPGSSGVNGTETGNSADVGDLTDNTCNTGVALADGDSDLATSSLTGITDAANDGEYYASSYYVVNTAAISVDKRMTKVVWDPVNEGTNPIAIPGAYVQYEITISNAVGAGASATLNTITDDLSLGGLAFDSDLVIGASTGPGPAPNDPEGGVAGEGIHVEVTGSTRPGTHINQYLTTTNADGDGADFGGTTADTLTASLQVILPADVPTSYQAGELKPGEDVIITFNAIIP